MDSAAPVQTATADGNWGDVEFVESPDGSGDMITPAHAFDIMNGMHGAGMDMSGLSPGLLGIYTRWGGGMQQGPGQMPGKSQAELAEEERIKRVREALFGFTPPAPGRM